MFSNSFDFTVNNNDLTEQNFATVNQNFEINICDEAGKILNIVEQQEIMDFVYYTYIKDSELNRCNVKLFHENEGNSSEIYLEYFINRPMKKLSVINYISELQYGYTKYKSIPGIVSELHITVEYDEA
ncbi:MAG: hypothetical protein QXZ44_06835 [Ferroplasma sp.]